MPLSLSPVLAAVLPAMPLMAACVVLLALPLSLPIPAPPPGVVLPFLSVLMLALTWKPLALYSALFWMSLDESGRVVDALIEAPDRLGYRGVVLGAMGGGHLPERMTDTAKRLAGVLPTGVSPRAGGGPMLRHTYGGPTSEIALREAGLIWGGRLHPLKARVLLETCLRAGLDRAGIGEIFDGWG